MMSADRFKIASRCTHTIEAFETAMWDSKQVITDVRLDDGTTNIDSLDSTEYSTEPYMEALLLT